MNTRSHIRIYCQNPAGKAASSTVFPLSPPGPNRITYAVRRNVRGGSQEEEVIVERVFSEGDKARQLSADNGGSEMTEELVGRSKEEQDAIELLSPALILIHIFPTSSTFLEALPSSKYVTLLRITAGRPPALVGEVVPISTPPTSPSSPGEHLLISLDSDCLITINNDIKLMYQSVEMSIAVPSTDRALEGEADVDVEMAGTVSGDGHSNANEGDQGDVDIVTGSDDEREKVVEGGLATPPQLEPGKEVTRVLDTPHGKEKFRNLPSRHVGAHTQESTFEPTPQPISSSKWVSSASGWSEKSRHEGEEDKYELEEEEEDDDQEEAVIPTMPTGSPLGRRSPLADKGLKIPGPRSVESLPSVIGTLPPSSGGITGGDEDSGPGGNATQMSTEKRDTGKGEDAEAPDSLPEAFHMPPTIYPQRAHITYGKHSSRNPHAQVQHQKASSPMPSSIPDSSSRPAVPDDGVNKQLPSSSTHAPVSPTPQSSFPKGGETSDSSPLQRLRGINSATGKGKLADGKTVIEESSPSGRQGEGMKVDEEEAGEDVDKGRVEEKQKATRGRGPRGRRSLEKPAPATQKRKRLSRGKGEVNEEELQEKEETGSPVPAPSIAQGKIEVQPPPPPTSKKRTTATSTRKENRKPPNKRARTSSGKEQASSGTQWTVPGSDNEGEDEEEEHVSESENEDNHKETSPHSPLTSTKPTRTPAKRTRKSTGGVSTASATPTKETPSLPSSQHLRTTSLYKGEPPKVVFSNSAFADRKDLPTILRHLGIKKAQKVTDKDVTHLVVGPGGLVRSSKLALAITLGTPVIEDTWLLESHLHNNKLLQPIPHYIPYDLEHEQEWGFNLSEAIQRGKDGVVRTLLKEYDAIYITPTLLSQLKSSDQETGFLDVLKAVGAGKVVKKAPRGSTKEEGVKSGLVFGGEKEKERDLVQWVEEGGWVVYRPEMLTVSILRGRLEVGKEGEEFMLLPSSNSQAGSAAGGNADSWSAPAETTSTQAPSRGTARRKSGRRQEII